MLILTGESRSASDLNYIGRAVKMASEYFSSAGIEIYPLNSGECRYLHGMGADYVTVFQETYDRDKYGELHLEGNKRIFPYRFSAQERALMGGMRGAGFGALLGLSDFRCDAFASGYHAYLLQKKYPHAEISMSCPRLRPIVNGSKMESEGISEESSSRLSVHTDCCFPMHPLWYRPGKMRHSGITSLKYVPRDYLLV